MEIGTVIFIVAIIGFAIASPGFRQILVACCLLIVIGMFWIMHVEDLRREKALAQFKQTECRNFFDDCYRGKQ